MFTGLIQEVAPIVSLQNRRLVVARPATWNGEDPIFPGESIAVDGCCLTALPAQAEIAFDLSPETLARTNLGSRTTGQRVNLERALRPQDRLGGHIVQGHVDDAGMIRAVFEEGNARVLRVAGPEGAGRFLIDKGSIALDGVSLTVVRPQDDEFEVWIVPHTLAATNLGERSPGDKVNLEFDVIAKYVERLVGPWRPR